MKGLQKPLHSMQFCFFSHLQLWMAEDCWLQARLYLGLEHSPEQQDNDSLCFSILVGHGQSHTFRVELASDLATWEKSFQRAVFLEVQRIRVSQPPRPASPVPSPRLRAAPPPAARIQSGAPKQRAASFPGLGGSRRAVCCFVVGGKKGGGATFSRRQKV